MKELKYFPILVLLLISTIGLSQSRNELEKKRENLLKDIELTTQLLKHTKQSKKSSLNELETLQKQINSRQALIGNISSQIRLYEKSIYETTQIIESMEADLESLRKEYSQMIYYTYKNQTAHNTLFFIFSSEDFNEAYKRLSYLKKYTSYRKKQADLIKKTKVTLTKKLGDIAVKKGHKRQLLLTQMEQMNVMDLEIAEKDSLIKRLMKTEVKLLSKIRTKRRAAEKLDASIADIIKKELNVTRKKETTGKAVEITRTPEMIKLSEEFSSNKGKLPWPVERGVVTGTFGEHPHPVLSRIKVQNNGIDIKTPSNSTVRSVFMGEVAEVFYNPIFHRAIMIRHGDYFTVYTNLKEVFVKKGEVIQTKQNIGRAYTDIDNARTEVHFEIWKGFEKLNPSFWIYRK